ncbi:MAG TPA: VOC family protein [Chlamydiales bacterium]|nr:VOC family protein [Chlamydiales bacterium]
MIKNFTSTVLALFFVLGSSLQAEEQKRFHLAVITNDLDGSLKFYENVFQRQAIKLDEKNGFVDFYGTILAFHEDSQFTIPSSDTVSPDQIPEVQNTYFVPSTHFGTDGLSNAEFEAIIEKLREGKGNFIIEPTLVNKGQPTEQTFAFIGDPQGYVIELRTLKNSFTIDQIRDYAQQEHENQKEAAL